MLVWQTMEMGWLHQDLNWVLTPSPGGHEKPGFEDEADSRSEASQLIANTASRPGRTRVMKPRFKITIIRTKYI